MKILSFNTTGVGTEFALNLDGEKKFLELEFSKHSETFFPLLEKFLIENKTDFNDLDCFGVVVGPGSFTGIRIGLSVAKMFSYVSSKPCAVVNALQVLAYNIFKQKKTCKICSVINAGAGNLYYQLFDENVQEITSPRICTFSQFEKIKEKFQDIQILYYDNNEKKFACQMLEEFKSVFSAESLDLCVNAKVAQKDFTPYKEITPLYIRNSQAEKVVLDEDGFKIIRGTKDDLKDILVLEESSSLDDLSWNENSLKQSFENESFKCYIITNKTGVIGYISFVDLQDEYEILRIIVSPKVRCQGAGQKLLEFLSQLAKKNGAEDIVLEVNEFNFSAILLYEKMGFKVVGKRPKYYHKGQDGFIMKKEISLE